MGIPLPDSRLAREATELIRDVTDDLIYHHSRRGYLFGAHHGHRHGLDFDPELLYVGALFHDLGLTEKFQTSQQRSGLDGADEARAFLTARDIPADRARLVRKGIALHTTPEIPHPWPPQRRSSQPASSSTSSAHLRQCEGRRRGPLRRGLHPPELRPDHRGLPLPPVASRSPPGVRFPRSEVLRAMDFASRRRSCNVVPATPTGKKNRRKAKRS